ncbi:hypothetical protein HG535_0C02090 [Zygotorulaspora mrakii]|uniref:Protein kinase domain-containing protein n=1 Tax=Zygotorulaspora mrakii TaxID=42260 RepID=A0A7H9B1L3_ZYGMR|nr:uncharacterized protein HG535_0C02090 [Zygotorulaspora mrakii]QLG71859.1 hypothetical protein HG535_0C02090 [Zygotorulaspora mrakii]
MIFSLDEDLCHLKLADSQNGIPAIAIHDESDDNSERATEFSAPSTKGTQLSSSTEPIPFQNGPKARRRSSVLERFPITTPPHTRRVSITPTSLKPDGNLWSDQKLKSARNLKDFSPVRVLGKGAYGKVILVRDLTTSKLYAMKQLKKAEIIFTNQENVDENSDEHKDSSALFKRIERTFAERTILSELEHPNIVKLFYSFHDNSKLYLLLQYIPGGELFFHLKEHGTLDEDTVAFYAAEISCALKFLHDKGIVYRDLKPENCLLDQNGHLVLTDFGLSKKSVAQMESDAGLKEDNNIMELHSIIGTPEYCAPEILQGLSYTKNCDWYSLGCLVYDMLVGKPPYTGANHKIILSKIQKQNVKLPYYLSDGMKDMLGALLKKEQGKRWDVDNYWRVAQNKTTKARKKRKAGQERTSGYTAHFVFRKINWKKLESGELQNSESGPIVPLITDWALAENFDTEFTSMSYEHDCNETNDLNIPNASDVFKGFSYKASGSYLDRYF